MSRRLRVAVIGVGHLGRFHAQKYASLPQCQLAAVADQDPRRAGQVGAEVGAPGAVDFTAILDQVDAVSVAVPTVKHYEVVKACLMAGKHVLVEKPLAATVAEAQELVTLAGRKGVRMQVGYLERFNPALVACRERIGVPHFIETLRIHSFLERGSDVDVVLDLMSHDLDLVLYLVGSPVRDVHAVGLSLMTERTDLANARLMFENGCVANLTASRISRKAERKMRLFQRHGYFSIDFAAPGAKVFAAGEPAAAAGTARVEEVALEVRKGDALLAEIESFVTAVAGGGTAAGGNSAAASGEDGLKAMMLAERVTRDILRNHMP